MSTKNIFVLLACCLMLSLGIESKSVKVSVIIPCYYKHAGCLDSLLELYAQQTTLPDEVVVVVSEDITNRVLFSVKDSVTCFKEKRLLLTAEILERQMSIDFNRIVESILLNDKNNIYIS